MSELPRTDDLPLDAERMEEAFASFAERVRELETVANELRAELHALRAERAAAPDFEDEEEWPAEPGASLAPSPDWVASVPPPLVRPTAAPRLVAEGAFLVVVALLAGLADLGAAWIALVMVVAWALVALSEWAAATTRARWHLEEVAPPLTSTQNAELDTTGPWDMPVVQATAIETSEASESRTVVATLPPQAETPETPETPETADDAEQTIAPSASRRGLRFWRRPPVEPAPDPWEA